MRLAPLYRVTFEYPEGWSVALAGVEQHFYVAEGRCEGAVAGRLRGANHPSRGADGTFCPDLQVVVDTTTAQRSSSTSAATGARTRPAAGRSWRSRST